MTYQKYLLQLGRYQIFFIEYIFICSARKAKPIEVEILLEVKVQVKVKTKAQAKVSQFFLKIIIF